MAHVLDGATSPVPARPAPLVSYRLATCTEVLAEPGTLAVFGFGAGAPQHDDPRWVNVPLEPLEAPSPLEAWQVEGPVTHGREGAVCWSAGSGWLFAAVALDEREYDGLRSAAAAAYDMLGGFVAQRTEHHVLRMWNYLGAINEGDGDGERYKLFCEGRGEGMRRHLREGFPAATAIGHHGDKHRLLVYLLACDRPGARTENPRQVSAWQYPRRYGRTSPGFARAMALPDRDALAISGTAAVVGHSSAHAGDPHAQLEETLANLEALLTSAGMPSGFDTRSPLKAYVRRSIDAPAMIERLNHRLPGVPVLTLHGDVCRQELLVEIDGWRYA